MVARRGTSLGECLRALSNQVGSYCPRRENFRLTAEVKAKFTEKLRFRSENIFGMENQRSSTNRRIEAGIRRLSWVCYRLSGTESVVRVYSEARDEPGLDRLSAAAKQLIFE